MRVAEADEPAAGWVPHVHDRVRVPGHQPLPGRAVELGARPHEAALGLNPRGPINPIGEYQACMGVPSMHGYQACKRTNQHAMWTATNGKKKKKKKENEGGREVPPFRPYCQVSDRPCRLSLSLPFRLS